MVAESDVEARELLFRSATESDIDPLEEDKFREEFKEPDLDVGISFDEEFTIFASLASLVDELKGVEVVPDETEVLNGAGVM